MGDRLAVVTGASRGIGLALTERLTGAGQKVAAIARSQAGLDDLATKTGAKPYVLDVADPDAVHDVFARIESELGVPDLLVNNAGIGGALARSWEQQEQDWWTVMEVNVRGTYLCSRAVLPSMIARGSGRIVNVSSGAATYPVGLAGGEILSSAYLASKAAVNRFSEALAGEVYADGVRVFAISPGMVKTDMTAAAFPDLWDSPDVWTPIGTSIDLIQDLDSGLLDGLTGRYLRAAVDDWRALAERVDEVIAKDSHAMRLSAL
ncbi:MAG: SDR family oxidoreductase [Actinomycetota bacterium]